MIWTPTFLISESLLQVSPRSPWHLNRAQAF